VLGFARVIKARRPVARFSAALHTAVERTDKKCILSVESCRVIAAVRRTKVGKRHITTFREPRLAARSLGDLFWD
jgi:hypothetical protein